MSEETSNELPALNDAELRELNQERMMKSVEQIGNGIKDVGEGLKNLGDVAKQNKREIRWYLIVALLLLGLVVVLVVFTLWSNPNQFTSEHMCSENGYTTKISLIEDALRFKVLYPNSTCYFVGQKEPGWIGAIKKIGGFE